MYGPDHNLEEHFNILDARDWRDAAGRQALLLARAGRLPTPIAAGIQMLMEPVAADAAHAQWVHTAGFDNNPVFSFAGAAWLALYNLGAASALRERWDLAAPTARLCGTSSGALVAAANAVGSPLSDSVVRCFEQWVECNGHVMGPWAQMDRMIADGLHSLTPPHAHTAVSHRLKVALASSIAPMQHEHGCAAVATAVQPPPLAGGLGLYEHPLPQAVGIVGLDAYWGPQVLPHRVHATHFESLPALFAAVRASCFLPCYSGAYAKLPRRALHTLHPAMQQQLQHDALCTCAVSQQAGQREADVAGRAAAGWLQTRPSAGTLRRLLPCSRPEAHACFDGAMTDNIPRWHGDEEFALLKLAAAHAGGVSGVAGVGHPSPCANDEPEDEPSRPGDHGGSLCVRSRSVSRSPSAPVNGCSQPWEPLAAGVAAAEACTPQPVPVPLVLRQVPDAEGAGSPGGDGPPCMGPVAPPLAVDLRLGADASGVARGALLVQQAPSGLQWTHGAVALQSGYVFDPRSDGLTVTVSPNAGAGAISPPSSARGALPSAGAAQAKHAGSPLAVREERPVSFDVSGSLGVDGWAGVHAVFPCPASVWWETFFAGRAHAQAWMAKHNFPPRPRGQGKPTR